MRSVFIHIKEANRQQLEITIKDLDIDDLSIGYYEDHASEYSPQESEKLKERLGIFPPDITVMADISGKTVGYTEAFQLAKFILSKFEGLVQDDSDGLWSLDELLEDKPSKHGFFMERSRRHAGLPIPEET